MVEGGGWRVEGGGWKVEGGRWRENTLQRSFSNYRWVYQHISLHPPPYTLHQPRMPPSKPPREHGARNFPARSKEFSCSVLQWAPLRAPFGDAPGTPRRCSGHPSATLWIVIGDATFMHQPPVMMSVHPLNISPPTIGYSLYTSLALAKVMISRCWLNLSSPLFIAI